MVARFVKKRKAAAALASALLVATAFQPAGCNVTLSPEMLSSLVGAVQDFAGQVGSAGQWFQGVGGPPFANWNHNECDDVDDDSSDNVESASQNDDNG